METRTELCKRFADAVCIRIGLPRVSDLRMISSNVRRSMSWVIESDKNHLFGITIRLQGLQDMPLVFVLNFIEVVLFLDVRNGVKSRADNLHPLTRDWLSTHRLVIE